MKSKILSILLVVCMALSALVGLTSCDDDSPTATPQKLSAPVVTLTDNVATWEADSNADKFEISLDGKLSYVENSVTSKTLTDGQTLKVRSVGDGSAYSTSDWSNSVTYTAATPAPQPTKLGTPTVTISDEGLASWTAVANASSYVYKINGGAETPTTATSVQLTDGQSIVVKAVGDGTNYIDGDYSASQTYTASTPAPQPTKLGTPTVTISGEGLASWTAVANASSYVYKINGGAETPTTATSVQLTDGQSIVVKAVGDGTNYIDGDYSASQTYTASTPTPTNAPTYLGIFASNNEPSSADGLPGALSVSPMMMSYRMMRAGSYRQFGTALDEYFVDSNNHFNANLPTESDYDIYSATGQTVYIQIWLNNPNQHTILSLKLNGTKYQVGGGLSSFFINEGGQHYNCVYVAVTIPNATYTEKTYTVTDIEYIADTYINADGTDEFMNNNDTVSIGLPYNAQNPTISDFNPTSLTMNSCSATLNVADANGLLNLTGGWLGIAIYDGYNIVANQSLAIGSNSVSATGLVENTYYWITVYLYADLHDGNGVTAHILFEQTIQTPSAITVEEINGKLLYNSEKDGYYGAIKVNTTLNSNTAEYIKLEILKGDEVVYTDTNFNGTATVSEGILCGNSYSVRVYYKDTEYPDGKYVEESAWLSYLGTPWYQEAGVYTFVNDAVYYFQLSNGDENYPAIDSFTLKLYKEESARWVANDVLYILEHPTAIDELNAQIDVLREQFNAAYGNDDLMWSIHQQISALEEQLDPLEYAQWYLENRADNNTDIAYWQAEAAKGKYYYEFEYNGTDTEKVFKVGKYYYVVLEDALTYGINSLDVEIDYKYDNQEGGSLTEDTVNEGINLDRALTNHWVLMENLSYSDGNLTLTLYNEEDWGETERPPYAIGYVYKVMANGEVLYFNDTAPTVSIDEDAWFAAYIARIKAGESVDDLMEQFVSDYESFYTIPLDTSKIQAGYQYFEVYIRLIATDYEGDDNHACRTGHLEIYSQLPTPNIVFNEYQGEVVLEGVDSWGGSYSYEAVDQNGDPVTLSTEGGSSFAFPAAGTKVRVKLMADGYWLASEWSDWVTFDGIKVAAPVFGEYDTTTCKIGWSAGTENVSHYLYTINGGTPVRVELDGNLSPVLNNGDVLRVMCVVSEDGVTNGYLDSEWVEYTCIDNRISLGTPTNVKIDTDSSCLVWDAVDGATYYRVECVLSDGGIIERTVAKLSIGASSNYVSFRVRAMTEDLVNYRASNYSESIVNTSEKS